MPSLKSSPSFDDVMSCPTASSTDDLQVAPEILAICRSTAWDLYKARNLAYAEIVARGLVAVDRRDWYHHALLGATLQKQRRFREALAVTDAALENLPGQPDLVQLRAEIFASSERLAEAERKLALTLPVNLAADDDDGPVATTPAQRRQHYLEMIRLVTMVLETQDEASTAWLRSTRA